jgi:hypothetical protein
MNDQYFSYALKKYDGNFLTEGEFRKWRILENSRSAIREENRKRRAETRKMLSTDSAQILFAFFKKTAQ